MIDQLIVKIDDKKNTKIFFSQTVTNAMIFELEFFEFNSLMVDGGWLMVDALMVEHVDVNSEAHINRHQIVLNHIWYYWIEEEWKICQETLKMSKL